VLRIRREARVQYFASPGIKAGSVIGLQMGIPMEMILNHY
jgi:hypothetical protein